MTNLNPNLDEYLDLMIATATGGYEKRWMDLKRNINSRIKRGSFYITPSEAEGIRYNSKKNKALRAYTMPVELKVLVSDALDDKPKTVSTPDPEPLQPSEIEAIAVGLESGRISVDEVRQAMGMAPLDEDDIKKPTSLDHNINDLKVKQSTISLNEAATDLIKFCTEWAREIREGKVK